MGELPQDNSQDLIGTDIHLAEAALQDGAEQIPVNVTNSAEPAAEPASEIVQQIDNGDNSLVDEPKALEEAYSAKEERDVAADTRKEIKQDAELLPEVEDFLANNAQDSSPEERDALRKELRDKMRPINSERGRGSTSEPLERAYMQLSYPDDKWMSGSREGREQALAEYQKRREKFAQEKDKFAAEVEDLAGIIHDHPISEKFRESHGGIDFSPRGLITFERKAAEKLAEVSSIEERIQALTATDFLDYGFNPDRTIGNNAKPGRNTVEWLADRLSKIDPDAAIELQYQYLQLTKKPETTTLQQLTEFFKDGFSRVFVSPDRAVSLAAKSVLDDVRSGRASEG